MNIFLFCADACCVTGKYAMATEKRQQRTGVAEPVNAIIHDSSNLPTITSSQSAEAEADNMIIGTRCIKAPFSRNFVPTAT